MTKKEVHKNRERWLGVLNEVFRPATPVNSLALFSGRMTQVQDVVSTINQNGMHAVLYGERGVGKTSLAKTLSQRIHRENGQPVLVPIVGCDSSDDYTSIWKKAFAIVQELKKKHSIRLSGTVSQKLASMTRRKKIDADLVRQLLTAIGSDVPLVVVLDEFDTLTEEAVRQQVADTIKMLSDRDAPVTLIIVGVGDDVDGLIRNHQSIERCLTQIRMPRMSRDELEEIVLQGIKSIEIPIDEDALGELSGLSKGLPHYTHLLALHSARNAVSRSANRIAQVDVNKAIHAAITGAQQSIRSGYQIATYSSHKNAHFVQTLLACAMSETDEFGFFTASDVRSPMNVIFEKEILLESFAKKLHKFCEEQRGAVLAKSELQRRARFRFSNPLMQPFVLMKGIDEKMIDEGDLNLLDDPQRRLF